MCPETLYQERNKRMLVIVCLIMAILLVEFVVQIYCTVKLRSIEKKIAEQFDLPFLYPERKNHIEKIVEHLKSIYIFDIYKQHKRES